MQVRSSFAVAKKGIHSSLFISIAELGDLVALFLLIAAMFSYGTSWTGLSAGDITLVRLLFAVVSVAIVLIKSKNRKCQINKAIILYVSLIIVEGILCPRGQASSVLQGILCLGVFLLPAALSQKYGIDNLIKLLIVFFAPCVLAMDLFCFATNGTGFLVPENEYIFSNNYYLGNKFVLSYSNMLLLALFSYRYRSRMPFVCFGAVALFACLVSECSTGVIGVLLMLAYTLWPFHKNNSGSRFTVPVLILTMAFVSIAGTWLMTLPLVQSFTMGVLGETSDFSGRLPIYAQIMDWVMVSPVFGYGSSLAANNIVSIYNGATDCQEGLFQIVMSNGLMGAALFLCVCFSSLRNLSIASPRVRGLHSYLIAMAVASLVEIDLGFFFLLGLSVVEVITNRCSESASDTSNWLDCCGCDK